MIEPKANNIDMPQELLSGFPDILFEVFILVFLSGLTSFFPLLGQLLLSLPSTYRKYDL